MGFKVLTELIISPSAWQEFLVDGADDVIALQVRVGYIVVI